MLKKEVKKDKWHYKRKMRKIKSEFVVFCSSYFRWLILGIL